MRRFGELITWLGVLWLGQALFASAAWAYIDPGTGSYLFQLLMAGLLGAVFAVKMAWRNVKTYLASWFARHHASDADIH
ncbi:MAG: hypothetical protein D6704_00955 [Nitrospirae bacterium]|nr:MAG: hypothetical protein D6704_00955 [Nitrospirota bacterium]